jgi:predicted nucleic acid-binding protein
MISWVVADSGIFLSAILVEEHTTKARSLMRLWRRQNIQIAAPTLLHYELVGVMRKLVHRKKLTAEQASKRRDLLLARQVELFFDMALVKRAYEFATQFNQPTAYDSQYLAVAERLNCEFWTADKRLYNAVCQDLTWVKWLGNFTP